MVSSKTIPMKDLNRRLGVYLAGTREIVIDDTAPAPIARAPVEAGLSHFIEIDNLPDVDDLPFIPERMRDFAYRYATEHKKRTTWAREYDVHLYTIDRWLQHKGVRTYIALARVEKRFYTMARRSALENQVWKRLREFLSIKITGDNAGALARILEFSYKILNAPEELNGREKGIFNQEIYIGQHQETTMPSKSPYVYEGKTPTPKQLYDLQERVDQLKFLEEKRAERESGNGS